VRDGIAGMMFHGLEVRRACRRPKAARQREIAEFGQCIQVGGIGTQHLDVRRLRSRILAARGQGACTLQSCVDIHASPRCHNFVNRRVGAILPT